jgi:hypothetical protein
MPTRRCIHGLLGGMLLTVTGACDAGGDQVAEAPPATSRPSASDRPTAESDVASVSRPDPGPAAASTATTATTIPADPAVARWGEDMRALSDGVRAIHPDPFWRQSEAEFDAAIAAAPRQLATMPPPLAAATVMRLTAGVDGHSGVYPFEVGFHAVALHLYDFGGAIHVVDAPDPGLIGLEVVAIDDTPIGDAIAAVVPYAAHDNDTTICVVVPMLLGTPEVLQAAGVARFDDGITYVLRAPDGVTSAVTPEALTWGEFDEQLGGIPVGLPADDRMMSLARRDEAFWWEPLDADTVYLQYNSVVASSGGVTINDITHGVGRALDAGADRLVIDLRHNNGGNNRTYRPLLQLLVSHPALAEPGALLVLIGRQTFSAATNFEM